MDRLLVMQTFVRVVETGSFSAVAREQLSTRSAISKYVSQSGSAEAFGESAGVCVSSVVGVCGTAAIYVHE